MERHVNGASLLTISFSSPLEVKVIQIGKIPAQLTKWVGVQLKDCQIISSREEKKS